MKTYLSPGRTRLRGVGLIELMIAMVLGALVVLGVVQVFTANKQSFRMQDAVTTIQETGTFAISFIEADALRAGLVNVDPAATDMAFDWVNTVDLGGTANDRLAFVFEPTATGARSVYCTGEAIGAATRASNRYWVNGNNELVCQGAAYNAATKNYDVATAAQVLAENVESFQILLGVDTDHAGCPAGAGPPTMYIRATAALVTDAVTGAIPRGRTACPEGNTAQYASTVIRTLRVGLLLRTPTAIGANVNTSRRYPVLDQSVGTAATVNDGRVRRVFTKTILLRFAPEVFI